MNKVFLAMRLLFEDTDIRFNESVHFFSKPTKLIDNYCLAYSRKSKTIIDFYILIPKNQGFLSLFVQYSYI